MVNQQLHTNYIYHKHLLMQVAYPVIAPFRKHTHTSTLLLARAGWLWRRLDKQLNQYCHLNKVRDTCVTYLINF